MTLSALLTELEWSGTLSGGHKTVPCCPVCCEFPTDRRFHGKPGRGHRPGCDLAAALAGNVSHVPPVGAPELVLSLFPGVGLLDRAFSSAGFIVVQAADKITGGDVCEFVSAPGRFDGIVAGPPCQGFSSANEFRTQDDHPSVVNSRQMLQETCRIIDQSRPKWFLIENVPGVPDVRLAGYHVQRIPISDFECGGSQLRQRHVQFGSLDGSIIRPIRVNDSPRTRKKGRPARAVTTKTDRYTDFPDLCRKQGLPSVIELPGWHRTAKFRAVGNGVPLAMGRALAAAVAVRGPANPDTDCACGCGRSVSPRALTATASCRKRKQLSRRPRPWVDVDGFHR